MRLILLKKIDIRVIKKYCHNKIYNAYKLLLLLADTFKINE